MAQAKQQKIPPPAGSCKPSLSGKSPSILAIDQQETMYELAKLGTGFFDGLVKVNQEMLRFYSDRTMQDLELQRELISCTKLSEALDVQSRFFQNTAQQYSDEAGRLLGLSNELIPGELNPMTNQIDS